MPKYGTNIASPPVKATDLKKEVVKKNKELKAQNKALTSNNKSIKKSIKESEKKLRSIDDLIFDRQMSLDSLDLTLMRRRDAVDKKESLLKEVIESLSNQMSERSLLEEEIQIHKDSIAATKAELGSLYVTIKSLEDKEQELENIQKDISKYKKASSNAKSSAKKAKEACKKAEANSIEKIASYKEEVIQTDRLRAEMDKKARESEKEYSATVKKQQEIIFKTQEEIKYASNKKKDMETAISNYKLEIEDLLDIISNKRESLDSIKEEYRSFKLKAFDEMARLKMRGKIENIDKAGLGDVFNK
tara:strand:+ start:3690 stop:4598 length:909 start_codon:yes stop_codon:yes gene_type:complete